MFFRAGALTAVCLTAAGVRADGGTVRLGGFVGRKADALIGRRILSPRAQGDVFAETERAFVTHYDDLNPQHGHYWQGEYWGKTMLGYTGAARYLQSAALKAFVREKSLKLVREHQQPDGYLGTYADKYWTKGGWNLWGRKYTLWALVEAYQLTGEREILDGASKLARQFIAQLKEKDVDIAETGCFAGMPSMSVLKPMLLLYRLTGEKELLAFAREIVARNDRADGKAPNLIANACSEKRIDAWYPDPHTWAKAYEMISCFVGFVEYARVTGERRPLEAAKRFWEKAARDEANALGSVGFHDKFVHARAYPNAISEVCDVICWMHLCRDLFLETGDGRYLDAYERCFYNAFLAGFHRDGEWGAHDVRSHGSRHLTGMYEVGMHYHFCCIDNAPRAFWDWAVTSFAETCGELCVNFYSDAVYADGPLRVEVTGGYPVSDRVRLSVVAPEGKTLRLRVPGWCAAMTVDGERASGGWHRVAVCGERTLDVVFDMPVRVADTVLADNADAAKATVAEGVTMFEMLFHNKEMKGRARTSAGARIMKGPLVLAKCTLAGANDAEVFDPETVNGGGWSAALEPLANAEVWGAWRLTLTKDGRRKTVNVCDYASAADFESWRNAFSIWF